MKDKELRKRLNEHGLIHEDGIGYRVAEVDHRLDTLEGLIQSIREQIDALTEYFSIEFEVTPKKLKVIERLRTA